MDCFDSLLRRSVWCHDLWVFLLIPLLPQVKGRHGKNSGKLRSLVLPVRLAYRLPLREAQSPQEQMHFRAVLPQAIESTWAPTLMNPLATSGVLGGVVGRWVPVVGEAILVVQGGNFVSCLWASDDNY